MTHRVDDREVSAKHYVCRRSEWVDDCGDNGTMLSDAICD